MRQIVTIAIISLLLIGFYQVPVHSKAVNETDTELCDAYKLALINLLRKPIDRAIMEIYKDDKNAPEDLQWASYDTEIIKIKQMSGIGGPYEITLKVRPYYRAHITYGEDEIVVNTAGKLISYEHLQTYPKLDPVN